MHPAFHSAQRLLLVLAAAAALAVILNPPRRPDTVQLDSDGDESILGSFQSARDAASGRFVDLPGGLAGIPALLQQVRSRALLPGRAVAPLTRLGPEAALALVPALDDADEAVREVAARTISALNVRLRSHAAEILPPLIRRLHDPKYSVRCSATLALCGLPVSGESAIAGLVSELEGSDSLPRSDAICLKLAAAHVLGTIGAEATAAVPALLLLLQDANVETHGVAAIALWRISGDTNTLLPALCASLSSTNETARFQAALILEKLQTEMPVVPCLVYEMHTALQVK